MHVQVRQCLWGTRLKTLVQTTGQSNVIEHLQSHYSRLNRGPDTTPEASGISLSIWQVVQCQVIHPIRQVTPGPQGQGAAGEEHLSQACWVLIKKFQAWRLRQS